MKDLKQRLIVLDGIDGSGKQTQADLLTNRLKRITDRPVLKISYPDYSSPSSTLVRMYLRGEIGSIEQVNVYAASSCYALDRYINYVNHWKSVYETGGIIVSDRYTTSNLIYQMPKLPVDEREAYVMWLNDYEHTLLQLPRPTAVLYLDMHPEISQKLMSSRYKGDETKKDIHEKNIGYLACCREIALKNSKAFGWRVIPCFNDRFQPLPVDTIADMVWQSIMSE